MRGEESDWPHVIVLDPFNAGMALARRMVRLGARVTVLEGQRVVARSRGVHGVVSAYKADGGSWLEVLNHLASSGEEGALLTATDRGSAWLVRESDRLPPNLRHFENPASAHLALMDKQTADRIAREAGVRVPWTAEASSTAELEPLLEKAPWPCVVKPVLSHEWRDRYGEKRSFFAGGAEEARQLMAEPLADGFRMLLSQYIPGGDEDVEEAI
ncbi:MAG TPA: hypothetical protein VIG42_08220, partial [Solirubrobacteraceae bacterium]